MIANSFANPRTAPYFAKASVKRLLPRLIEHVREGRIDPKALITHRLSLEDVSDGYRIFSGKLDGCIKPVLYPNGIQEGKSA